MVTMCVNAWLRRSLWADTSGVGKQDPLPLWQRLRRAAVCDKGGVMATHKVVEHDEWLEARKKHLVKEKEFTRLRDQLSHERRELPWEQVEKNYVFQTRDGRETLADLFAGSSQLIVYHFMFAPEWDGGCKSCSFWADNFNGIISHLRQRDVTL